MLETQVPGEPFALFDAWFADVAAAGLPEPNAMILATASADGVPSARTVLLKGYGPGGFRFFTNLTSDKARDLAANPRAALVFPWHAMYRQVRVMGRVEPLTHAENEAYFSTRPYGSQLGAWASRQSTVIAGRDELEARYAELAERWPDPADSTGRAGGEDEGRPGVPRPDFWGGYAVLPESVEFWQGRPDRLHDRLRYRRADTTWVLERLAP
ncbi:pyridoxamine 5'-phosphate oxidase [Actinomadura fulvescens]|uniref:Pyridoxine/pyridoxamine 5'-phosphate oxidase n=1 Tax=Actinomadura fulvescens TaxID=46160 RepID=A0ABP6DFC7_9ACTN